MIVKGEDRFDAQLTHCPKRGAIYKTKFPAIGCENMIDSAFMLERVEPLNLNNRREFVHHTPDGFQSKPILDDRNTFNQDIVIRQQGLASF